MQEVVMQLISDAHGERSPLIIYAAEGYLRCVI